MRVRDQVTVLSGEEVLDARSDVFTADFHNKIIGY